MTLDKKNLASTDNSQTSSKTSQEKIDKKSRGKTEIAPTSWQTIRENAITVTIALVIALLLRLFIAEPRYIPSDSMVPTLEEGDRLIVEKVAYRFHPPERGDIIVFQPPIQLQMQGYDSHQAFIKRVIATSGQTVTVQDGTVYVDSQPLTENYIAELPQYNLQSVTVPEGKLFVMGDNRNNSNDSHIWGFLPQENIIGHAIFKFWPFSRIGVVR
jgi:signal peptidase I